MSIMSGSPQLWGGWRSHWVGAAAKRCDPLRNLAWMGCGQSSIQTPVMKPEMLTLLIDDDAVLLERLERIAKQVEGVQTVVARSGGEALKVIDTAKPDLVLSDIQLPDMDGYTICQQLRQKMDKPLCDIWFITGDTVNFDRGRASEVGASGYVLKPFGSQKIRHIVSEARDQFRTRLVDMMDS